MTDAEIRGRLLAHFYALRHSNGGWVPISDLILAPEPVQLCVIGGVCQQLADIGLIQWKPLQDSSGLVAGTAKITGQGTAAVEAGRSADIAIRFLSTDGTVPCVRSGEADPVTHAVKASLPPAPQQAGVGQQPEILQLKPTFMGFSVDLKALWRRCMPTVRGWWRSRS